MAPTAQRRYAEIMHDVEELINDHSGKSFHTLGAYEVDKRPTVAHQKRGTHGRSKLKLLVPAVGVFFTPLLLEEAFGFQDERRKISSRRFVPPSFNDLRIILNSAQMMSLVRNGPLELVTFDGDVTLYDDGESLNANNPVISRILRLLSENIKVGIVTAAGYSAGSKYYQRLCGLLEAIKAAIESQKLFQPVLVVLGGESNYLFEFDRTEKSLLRYIPRATWLLEEMKSWTVSDVESLLDVAETALRDCVKNLGLSADVVRKERAVGIVPSAIGRKFTREQLEETVLVTQQIVEMSAVGRKLPFCAFNGGNDVFVDIGDKSWGVRACQKYVGGIHASKTLHVGDQFLSAGANDFKARLACTTAWIANPAETVELLDELAFHAAEKAESRCARMLGASQPNGRDGDPVLDWLALSNGLEEGYQSSGTVPATDMPPFKDEHVLIIAPGSQTTLAQLGLPDSFTPARLRVSTRMFPAEKSGEWEPKKVREKKVGKLSNGEATTSKDGQEESPNDAPKVDIEDGEEEIIYEEDPTTDEGAVYPLENGRVVNWSCFFALLTHVYNTLSPPFHTPILVIAQPAWTEQDHETLTQFFFEKFKTPAFCLMDSALAVCYAFGVSTATVVDVGYRKCDITAVSDFLVNDLGRGTALAGCGGEDMTRRLQDLLGPKGFTRDMCEQLKKSTICEILPANIDLPSETGPGNKGVTNPAAAASTGANGVAGALNTAVPRGPGYGTQVGQEDDGKDPENDDGVLDVASIVASGKTSEFLAKKEREKAEKAAAKKAAADTAAAAKLTRLPNSQRFSATLHYDERRSLDELDGNGKRAIETDGTLENGELKRPKTPPSEPVPAGTDAAPVSRKEERRRNKETALYIRKDVEVGIERFKAADIILEQIADSVHRCILSVPEVSKRSELWESMIILGNGSKVRGFKEALLSLLTTKYLISPSSATIFTSELPSNFSTPLPTGANTPQPQLPSHHLSHTGGGVNPLLLAATTASNPTLAPPGSHQHLHSQLQLQNFHQQQQAHSSHGQTPSSIKAAKMPEYFSEWKEVGTEEAGFLGAQVAAKVIFIVDQGLSKGFMSRAEYNELGPQGIHEFGL